jgi:hypothetical protein
MAKSLLDKAKEAVEENVQELKERFGIPTDRSVRKRVDEATRVEAMRADQDKIAKITRRN